jgi:aspartyl-tRNA(Asn)/glutamyl-tRNA(Gln) amidotransferase subunit B
VRWLGICDGNMQEGSFRCDANVSVRARARQARHAREIKNVNSFRFVEKAIDYEIERRSGSSKGGSVVQETRLYDETAHRTRSMRGKESAHDYRYFPDPDLPTAARRRDSSSRARALPELPAARTRVTSRSWVSGLRRARTDRASSRRRITSKRRCRAFPHGEALRELGAR